MYSPENLILNEIQPFQDYTFVSPQVCFIHYIKSDTSNIVLKQNSHRILKNEPVHPDL